MAEPARGAQRWLFTLTILTGSFLLFLVQPMVARMALPRLGGAPNVWNSAMLVYQALLLGGYAYAHALSRLPITRQAVIHVVLLLVAGLTLPLSLPDIAPPAPGREALWVPWLFLLTVGPVFFVVSAQAPLMQRWFAANPAAGDPYPLYAASNLGSFAGLLSYPLLAEPLLQLDWQTRGWAVGYAVLVVLVGAAAWARRGAGAPVPDAPAEESATVSEAPNWRRIALWLALSAVPSGLMLSTTTHLTTDIVAMPLLWVIPLGLYLLSFSIAFSARRELAEMATAPVILLAAGGLAMLASDAPSLLAAAASLVLLFVVAIALHARLYATRPGPERLTQFYLVMSAGGALGGVFTALLAPLWFDWTWEHPLLIIAAACLIPLGKWPSLLPRRVPSARLAIAITVLLLVVWLGALWLNYKPTWGGTRGLLTWLVFGVAIAAGTLLAVRRWSYVAACLILLAGVGGVTQAAVSLKGERTRSYFGIYTVSKTAEGEKVLFHGTTIHGIQLTEPARRTEPTTYYGPTSGAGLTLRSADRLFGPGARIGVVGLGVGTLACYRRPGQAWTFYEIDPAVLAYSRRRAFTFLEICAKDAPVVIGDARLKLAEAPPASFDILAIDAFSSDAIPLHLLTDQAQAIYFRDLSPDGLLLFHISNRFIELEPVLAALARHNHLAGAVRNDVPAAGWPQTPSKWVVLTRSPDMLAKLEAAGPEWSALGAPSGTVWTDGYASILPHLKLFKHKP